MEDLSFAEVVADMNQGFERVFACSREFRSGQIVDRRFAPRVEFPLLLRHESVATTQAYLHPTREDLADALARLQVVRSPDSQTER